MANGLAALSKELAAAVERAGRSAAAVHARPRFSSSGVVWRKGVIVTAEHTVRREEDVKVTLPDGSTVPATVAGSDAGTDIAVLKVDAAETAATITGTADLRPGELILTVGRSEDSGVNATMGIVSAVSGPWRTWRGGKLDQYVRLDLTLYPGSSGAAVVNTAGETVGVATGALSRIAGVAIPASTVNRVVEEILTRGRVSRGYLGVGMQPVEVPDHLRKQGGYGSGPGLIVLSLQPDGPAARAGVLVGDILVALAGTPVHDTDEIQTVLEKHAIGQSVTAGLIRAGAPAELAITVGERPRRD